MRRTIATLLLAGLAGTAQAQYRAAPPPAQPYPAAPATADEQGYDDGYDDPGYGGYGYAPPYRPQAPNQGGQPQMPAYRDDGRWGATESYGSGDARTGAAGAGDAAEYRRRQEEYRAQLDDYHRRMRDYRGGSDGNDRAARAAELRARAAACERGDDAACD